MLMYLKVHSFYEHTKNTVNNTAEFNNTVNNLTVNKNNNKLKVLGM